MHGQPEDCVGGPRCSCAACGPPARDPLATAIAALARERDTLLTERAELRGDVMALWQRLGDVLALLDPKAFLKPEQQLKLANARAVHALWSEAPAPAPEKERG